MPLHGSHLLRATYILAHANSETHAHIDTYTQTHRHIDTYTQTHAHIDTFGSWQYTVIEFVTRDVASDGLYTVWQLAVYSNRVRDERRCK